MTDAVSWVLGEDGSVYSPTGARVAKIHDGTLQLYDKRTRTSLPFTVDDHQRLLAAFAAMTNGSAPTPGQT